MIPTQWLARLNYWNNMKVWDIEPLPLKARDCANTECHYVEFNTFEVVSQKWKTLIVVIIVKEVLNSPISKKYWTVQYQRSIEQSNIKVGMLVHVVQKVVWVKVQTRMTLFVLSVLFLFLTFDFCRFCVVIRICLPATTANSLRLRRIFYPRFYPLHLFSYLNSWERASIFPF